MRRKPLRAVLLAGILLAAGGALVHQLLFGSPLLVHLASGTGAMLATIRQWIWLAVVHISPAHLLEGVGVAWFIFVLALLLLTFSDRAKPLDRKSPVRVSPVRVSPVRVSPADEYDVRNLSIAEVVDSTPEHDAPPRRSWGCPPVSRIPAIPGLPALYRSLLDPPYAAADNVSADTAAVNRFNDDPPRWSTAVQLPVNDRCGQWNPATVRPGPMSSPSLQRKNGHLLALTGMAATERQLMPYGLFLVAEDVGATSSSGEASRRTVDVIANQIAPLLANDAALGSEHLAALFEMVVLRASMALRHHGIRTAADLGAVVVGMMMIGNDVYVVNVGHCRAYLFRPGTGLQQISMDHSMIFCLAKSGLLPPAALYQYPQQDQIYRSVRGHQAQATEVDTYTLCVQPDDQLVLCSPNLWQSLSTREIEAVVCIDTDPQSTAERLSRAASGRGAGTASVIVVRPLAEWTPAFGFPAA